MMAALVCDDGWGLKQFSPWFWNRGKFSISANLRGKVTLQSPDSEREPRRSHTSERLHFIARSHSSRLVGKQGKDRRLFTGASFPVQARYCATPYTLQHAQHLLDTYCMASQGRSWNDHFCTEIGDKPLVANSFPSARLLKNGEVISLFFGSGSRDSNRVRASEKSRNWGGPLRVGEYSTPNADQPFLDQGAKCRPGCSSRPRGSALHNGTAEERPGPSWDVDI